MTGAARPARLRRWPAGLVGASWLLTLLGLAGTAWLDQLLRQAGRPELAWFESGNIWSLGTAMVAATVGALVAGRRPRHPVGWLLLAMGLSLAVSGALSGYRWYGVVARPGALPAAGHLAGLANGVNVVHLSCAGFILLLTPTGSLPSRRWRWWARIALAAAVLFVLATAVDPLPFYPQYPEIGNPLGVQALAEPPLDLLIPVAGAVVLVALVVGAWSLVGRFRRAHGTERQQLRWLAWGGTLAAAALVAAIAELVVHGDTALWQAAVGLCLAALTLATGAAVLRYRLYDLDRIISRTLAYGLLTILLGGGYAMVVLGLGQLLGPDSSLVVAAATLALAAAFQPARRRLQRLVDRRFNRRRHDAAQTINAFGARLRDQVDLDTLTGELLAVVHQTIQPTTATLWLRPRDPTGRPAAADGRRPIRAR